MIRLLVSGGAVVVLASLLNGGAVIASAATGLPAWTAVAVGVVLVVGISWTSASMVPALGGRGGRGGRVAVPRTGCRIAVVAALTAATMAASSVYLVPTTAAPLVVDGIRLRDGSMMPVRVHEREGAELPLVAVHGGPGVPFTALEEDQILAAAPGRTVIFYDQVGAGRASRLGRPSDYSMRRAVDDLGELLDRHGIHRGVLLGYSSGASVIELFASEQPERVEALVLLAPGSLPVAGRRPPVAQPQSRLSPAQTAPLYAAALSPRNLFMYLLTLANPDTAHQFGGDAEMDGRFAELEHLAAGGLTCSGRQAGRPASPPGHYLHQQLGREPGLGLTTDGLRRLSSIPVLLLRGRCDYIPRGESEYTAAQLHRTLMIDIDDAGHALLEEQPAVVRWHVRRFLAGLASTERSIE